MPKASYVELRGYIYNNYKFANVEVFCISQPCMKLKKKLYAYLNIKNITVFEMIQRRYLFRSRS